MDEEEGCQFNDPIHGLVTFGPTERMIVDTYEVQRLQEIKQLSFVFLVYRSANNTRFEHSLGVAHLVRRAAMRLSFEPPRILKENEKLKPTKEDLLILQIAGWIHDVGHGPFGHMTEALLDWFRISPAKHEEYTKRVIRGEYRDVDSEHYSGLPGLYDVLEKLYKTIGLSPEEMGEIVDGRWFPGNKLYLSQLISSPIDLDRLDYLVRDSHYVGVARGGIDMDSIINALTVVKTSGEEIPEAYELAIDLRALTAAEALLTTRDLMYTDVYYHPINRAAQGMMIRATKKLIDMNKIDIRHLVRMTDYELLLELQEYDETREVAERVKTRRIYAVIPELEYTYGDLVMQNVWSEIVQCRKFPRHLEKLEKELTDEIGLDEGEIIIDLASLAKFYEAEARVSMDDGYEKLEAVSSLTNFIKSKSYERHWRMMVFAPFSKGDKRRAELINKVRKKFGLTRPPSKYAKEVPPLVAKRARMRADKRGWPR